MDRELSYVIERMLPQMPQEVNQKMRNNRALLRRRRAFARKLLLWIGLGTGANWLLLQLKIPFRIYLSAGFWYYVNLLPGWHWIGTALCALSVGIGLLLNRPALTFWLYGADTALVALFALLFLESPLCCLPELAVHCLVLFLLRRSFIQRKT